MEAEDSEEGAIDLVQSSAPFRWCAVALRVLANVSMSQVGWEYAGRRHSHEWPSLFLKDGAGEGNRTLVYISLFPMSYFPYISHI